MTQRIGREKLVREARPVSLRPGKSQGKTADACGREPENRCRTAACNDFTEMFAGKLNSLPEGLQGDWQGKAAVQTQSARLCIECTTHVPFPPRGPPFGGHRVEDAPRLRQFCRCSTWRSELS
jgi:hypothetical protein